MKISDIPIPEIYLESNDFRFFLKWFESAITKIQFDTENLLDLYDPQRCPEHLLWMLADTMGYKYDDRLTPAFCRLVLMYFMSMIRYKGSKSGVTLAAEVNLAQFNLLNYGKENDILNNRLEDTSIPVNSVYVTAHTAEGFIDVVYFSENKPVDACIEYVRPLGMYCFQHAGVAVDARTKISVDARLTAIADLSETEDITRVGHYTRNDYARMQKTYRSEGQYHKFVVDPSDTREDVYRRNSVAEYPSRTVDAGYRALSSLQMSNNEHIVKSLLPSPIFELGYDPQDVQVSPPPTIDGESSAQWNLLYNYYREFDTPHTRPSTAEHTASHSGENSFVTSSLIDYLVEVTVNGRDRTRYATVDELNPRVVRLVIAPTEVGSTVLITYIPKGAIAFNKHDILALDDTRTPSSSAADPSPIPAVNPIMSQIGDAMVMNNTNSTYTKYNPSTHQITVEDVDPNPRT